MITPAEIEAMPLELESHFKELEIRIMDDIIRKLKENGGEITRATDWQIHRLYELGTSKMAIQEAIQKALNLSDKEIQHIYTDIISCGYARDESIYKALGKEFISFEDNEPLQQLIRAVEKQTETELYNITQSMGFAVEQPDGKIKFKPIAAYYQDTLDKAMLDISSGAFDYNTVLKRVVKELTNSGLRTVDYASGWSNRVPVAVRRAVVTGFNQVVAKVNEDNAEKLETDTFEVSWHSGHRPSHWWGGRWFTKAQLVSDCHLGEPDGLCGCNCYHSYSPVVPGVSVPTYTTEQLEEMESKEQKTETYNDKAYTKYKALQRQRRLETKMRAQRQEIHLLQEGEADNQDIISAQARYRATSDEYVRFSEAMGLPQQRERVSIDGLKNVENTKFGKTVENSKKHDIINSRSEVMALEYQRYGRNKDTVVNKSYIDSGEYKRKFDNATSNPDVNKSLYNYSKTALKHRSGTKYEDMYWIDSNSGKVVLSVTDSTEESAIIYSDRIKSTLKKNKNIISLHTHPNSMPPSIADLNSCFSNNYKVGFVACHNGKVFGYTSNEVVSERLYTMYIQKFLNNGFDEYESQIRTLNILSQSYDIRVWEVTHNG